MKLPSLNPFYKAAVILVVMALILVIVAALTERHDLTSSALVVMALISLLTGILIATLSGSEPIEERYISLLPVQYSITIAQMCADTGIHGNACIIPSDRSGTGRTAHFVPVSVYRGMPTSATIFAMEPKSPGIFMDPPGLPLLHELLVHDRMVIPVDANQITLAIHEMGEEVLEIAERINCTVEGGTFIVNLKGYRFISGCLIVARESPRCCIVSPCPVCSLMSCIIAEGTGSVVRIERCDPDAGTAGVTAVFTLLED